MRTITIKDMDDEGKFKCPKCGGVINPDEEEDFEILEASEGETKVKIRHKCGEEIEIDLESAEFDS